MKILLLPLILLLMPSMASSQAEVTPAGTDETEEAFESRQEESANAGTGIPAESFIPTETISEDLSVPFPVDI